MGVPGGVLYGTLLVHGGPVYLVEMLEEKKTLRGKPEAFKLNALATTYSPTPSGGSTIGADGLNFSVRNGKRCFPIAIITRAKPE